MVRIIAGRVGLFKICIVSVNFLHERNSIKVAASLTKFTMMLIGIVEQMNLIFNIPVLHMGYLPRIREGASYNFSI